MDEIVSRSLYQVRGEFGDEKSSVRYLISRLRSIENDRE